MLAITHRLGFTGLSMSHESIKIESGIPIPDPAQRKSEIDALLTALKVGDSFLIRKTQYASFGARARALGIRITVRSVDGSNPEMFRLWRVSNDYVSPLGNRGGGRKIQTVKLPATTPAKPAAQTEPFKGYADKDGIAKMFFTTTRTVENWMREGKIPFIKIGGIVRFDIAVVQKHFWKQAEQTVK